MILYCYKASCDASHRLAKHLNKTFKPGIETLEAKYFDYKDIPWKTLAFPSVTFALKKIGKLPKNLPIFHTFNKD